MERMLDPGCTVPEAAPSRPLPEVSSVRGAAADARVRVREFDANDPANADVFHALWECHVAFEERHWGDDATPYAQEELRTMPDDQVRRYDHFVAERDGQVVAGGVVVRRLTENQDLATVIIGARDVCWSEKAQSVLLAEMDRVEHARGLRRFAFSLEVPMSWRERVVRKWCANGWELYSEGRRLDLDLPDGESKARAVGTHCAFPEGYELVLSKDMPSEELRHEQVPLREEMFWDDERGGLAVERRKFDEPRVRRYYDLNLRAGRHFWTAMARCRRTGRLVGYSDLTTTGLPNGYARQEDTFVLPEHRRRGIGLALKRATLAALLADEPDIQGVRTWTALANAAMMSVNHRMGFVDKGADLNLLHRL